jgi:hypothetical protein
MLLGVLSFILRFLSPVAGWLAWDGLNSAGHPPGSIRNAVAALTVVPLSIIFHGTAALMSGYWTDQNMTIVDQIGGTFIIAGCLLLGFVLGHAAEKHQARLFASGRRLHRTLWRVGTAVLVASFWLSAFAFHRTVQIGAPVAVEEQRSAVSSGPFIAQQMNVQVGVADGQ